MVVKMLVVICVFIGFNQFAPGIFLVFPDTHLFLAKNLKKFLAINKFILSMKLSPDTQINAFFIDILRI